MNLLIEFLKILSATMNTPDDYGWFHLLFIFLFIIITFVICFYFKDSNTKTFNNITLIVFCIMFTLEIYKQIVLSYSITNDTITWDYNWYNFPFQLCSSPLYILPLIVLIKNENIKEMLIFFISTFSLAGGLIVFIYPNDVFISIIGINIQTMIHHGLQISLGIYYMMYYRKKLNINLWAKSINVFIILVIISLFLNITMYHILNTLQISDVFNMYFISPYFPCTLPILSTLYDKLPYILFLLIYIVGFIIASFIIYYIFNYIFKTIKKQVFSDL